MMNDQPDSKENKYRALKVTIWFALGVITLGIIVLLMIINTRTHTETAIPSNQPSLLTVRQDYSAIREKFINDGEADKAAAFFEKEIKKYPENALLRSELGWTYLALEEYTRAQRQFEEAVELSPESSYYLYSLAKTYGSRGEFHMAVKIMKNVLRLERENPLYYREIASLYERQGEERKALMWEKKAVAWEKERGLSEK